MKKKSGFTIVEVSLFLAITAAVFVGIAIGTQNSIFQQRYNDSVQNFAEFLRSVYSQVTNVQSEGSGRTGYAIYGKLVVFGSGGETNKIRTFNVIGKVEADGNTDVGGGVLGQLKSRNATVLYCRDNNPCTTVGMVEDYIPKWSAQIQTTKEWENDGYDIFEGALLIARSPDTGSVNTYIMTNDGIGDYMLDNIDNQKNPFINKIGDANYLTNDDGFKKADMNFCINPNGADKSNLRRNVRIVAGARNSSGIVVVPDDESGENGNKCK